MTTPKASPLWRPLPLPGTATDTAFQVRPFQESAIALMGLLFDPVLPVPTARQLRADTQDTLFSAGAEPVAGGLAGAFRSSYRSLAADEQDMFRALGLVPGPDFDAFAAASITGIDPGAAGRRLDSLVRHNLLMQPAAGRYRFHDLIRVYARELSGQAGASGDHGRAARTAGLGQLLDYYLHAARAADRQLTRRALPAPAGEPVPAHVPVLSTRQQAIDWMEAERLNLDAATAAAVRVSPGHAVAIPAAMNAFLCIQGHWDQARKLGDAALETARRTSDQHAQATALANLATLHRLAARFPAALASAQDALMLYRDAGDQTGAADTLAHLGRLQYLTDDLAAAAGSLSRALELYRGLGDQAGEAGALTHLGYVLYVTGESADVIGSLSRAIELCRGLGDRAGQVDALSYLGIAQYESGQYAPARASFTQMLRLCRAIGDRNDEAWALNYLGYVQTLPACSARRPAAWSGRGRYSPTSATGSVKPPHSTTWASLSARPGTTRPRPPARNAR